MTTVAFLYGNQGSRSALPLLSLKIATRAEVSKKPSDEGPEFRRLRGLCHNSEDKSAVHEIAQELSKENIKLGWMKRTSVPGRTISVTSPMCDQLIVITASHRGDSRVSQTGALATAEQRA